MLPCRVGDPFTFVSTLHGGLLSNSSWIPVVCSTRIRLAQTFSYQKWNCCPVCKENVSAKITNHAWCETQHNHGHHARQGSDLKPRARQITKWSKLTVNFLNTGVLSFMLLCPYMCTLTEAPRDYVVPKLENVLDRRCAFCLCTMRWVPVNGPRYVAYPDDKDTFLLKFVLTNPIWEDAASLSPHDLLLMPRYLAAQDPVNGTRSNETDLCMMGSRHIVGTNMPRGTLLWSLHHFRLASRNAWARAFSVSCSPARIPPFVHCLHSRLQIDLDTKWPTMKVYWPMTSFSFLQGWTSIQPAETALHLRRHSILHRNVSSNWETKQPQISALLHSPVHIDHKDQQCDVVLLWSTEHWRNLTVSHRWCSAKGQHTKFALAVCFRGLCNRIIVLGKPARDSFWLHHRARTMKLWQSEKPGPAKSPIYFSLAQRIPPLLDAICCEDVSVVFGCLDSCSLCNLRPGIEEGVGGMCENILSHHRELPALQQQNKWLQDDPRSDFTQNCQQVKGIDFTMPNSGSIPQVANLSFWEPKICLRARYPDEMEKRQTEQIQEQTLQNLNNFLKHSNRIHAQNMTISFHFHRQKAQQKEQPHSARKVRDRCSKMVLHAT